MIALIVIIGVVLVVDALALRFGADSRDGDDWSWHRHSHPLRSRTPG
jgi:hypothetical protein